MVCVKRCCCCVNLRVGGTMTGVMTLGLSVFSLIPMALSLVNRVDLARVITHLHNRYVNTTEEQRQLDSVSFWGTVLGQDAKALEDDLPPADSERVVWLSSAMLYFFIGAIILLAIYAICSVLLIFAAAKGKPRLMLLPWLILTMFFLAVYFLGMIVTMILVGIQVLSVLLFFIALTEICIALYIWTCVLSLFQVLGSQEWRDGARDDWQMIPRFSTKYDGVPTQDH